MSGTLRLSPAESTGGMTSASPSPSKASEGRIPFISVGDAEGEDWPTVSMTKEAQEFIAQMEGPICVLVCMGQQGSDKVGACEGKRGSVMPWPACLVDGNGMLTDFHGNVRMRDCVFFPPVL